MVEEQLSMDFETQSMVAPEQPEYSDYEHQEYEYLDVQLADLLIEQNNLAVSADEIKTEAHKQQNKLIRQTTLEISKHTREGQIAIPVDDKTQKILLQSKVVGEAHDYQPLIIDNGHIYMRRYFKYQQHLAERIQAKIAEIPESEVDQNWLDERLDHYFPAQSEEKDWQRYAAEMAIKQSFVIISGGPGTGKTTTITRLLALLIEQFLKSARKRGGVSLDSAHGSPNDGDIIELSVSEDETASSLKKWEGTRMCRSRATQEQLPRGVSEESFSIALAAPTGKAAIRMLDAIREAEQSLNISEEFQALMPNEANTIHKLLGYQHGKVTFKQYHDNPLQADVVLLDEASMIDIALMAKLFDAIGENTKIILIGDRDQLDSVETGSVFADLCEGLANSDNLVTLKKNWRFDKDSGIGQAAKAANKGDSQELLNILKDETHPDCQLLLPEKISDEDLLSPWNDYFTLLKNPSANISEIFEAFNQYRILSALRRGLHGSTHLNKRLENVLQKQGVIRYPRGSQSTSGSSVFYHGRPIMITKNDYAKDLFNGDTGIALKRDGELQVYFPDSLFAEGSNGQFKHYAPVRLPAHETNWAMTIHKSQGSEFDQVALILPQEEMPLLSRQLIYTGITRAKKQVKLIATEAVVKAGVKSKVVKATRIGLVLNLKCKLYSNKK